MKNVKNIVPVLINAKANEEVLKETAYVPFLDLAIAFRIAEDSDKAHFLTKKGMKEMKLNELTLLKEVMKNKAFTLDTSVQSMENLLMGMLGDGFESDLSVDMLVCTNKMGFLGASVILNSGIMKGISDKFDSNLLIIPSSIHEVLITGVDNMEMNTSEVAEMINAVNMEHVSENERLSDHPYIYCRVTGAIIIPE